MGKPVEAGVAERRTGTVCESRGTILAMQLDTEHTYGSVQGNGKNTRRSYYKVKKEKGKKQEKKMGKQRIRNTLIDDNKHTPA